MILKQQEVSPASRLRINFKQYLIILNKGGLILKYLRAGRCSFLLLVWMLCGSVWAQGYPSLRVTLDTKGNPLIHYSAPEGTKQLSLLRSTSDLAFYEDAVRYPIAKWELPADGPYSDDKSPQGVELTYQLEATLQDGQIVKSAVVSAWVPKPKVAKLHQPHLMVDKLAYTLYLMDGQRVARRFPVALGANPTNRKLHLDRASTPEGIYKISNLQPVATYHRAYDINYPNKVDKVRYNVANRLGLLPRSRPHIGGEIQIHGGGIDENWTWGCIALRDFDMDWLFSRAELKRGVQIAIAGSELRFSDLQAIASTTLQEKDRYLGKLKQLGLAGASFSVALGRFQYQAKLPVTTQLDLRTRELLEQYLRVGAR